MAGAIVHGTGIVFAIRSVVSANPLRKNKPIAGPSAETLSCTLADFDTVALSVDQPVPCPGSAADVAVMSEPTRSLKPIRRMVSPPGYDPISNGPAAARPTFVSLGQPAPRHMLHHRSTPHPCNTWSLHLFLRFCRFMIGAHTRAQPPAPTRTPCLMLSDTEHLRFQTLGTSFPAQCHKRRLRRVVRLSPHETSSIMGGSRQVPVPMNV
jgi:hypothetical protein